MSVYPQAGHSWWTYFRTGLFFSSLSTHTQRRHPIRGEVVSTRSGSRDAPTYCFVQLINYNLRATSSLYSVCDHSLNYLIRESGRQIERAAHLKKSTIKLITKEAQLSLSNWTAHNCCSAWPNPAALKTKHNRQLCHPSARASKHVPTDRCRRRACIAAQQHHALVGCPRCWSEWLSSRACQILRHLARPILAALATPLLYKKTPWSHQKTWITSRSAPAAYLSVQINL